MNWIDYILQNWTPHGHCYNWTPDVLWMNVIGDAGTFIAYVLIPLALYTLSKKYGKDYWAPFRYTVLLFCAFIFLCGISHLIDVITVWNGNFYRVQGYERVLTAIVSLITAVLLSISTKKIKINTYRIRNDTIQITEIELPPVKIKNGNGKDKSS